MKKNIEKYAIPTKPIVPSENDPLDTLVNKVKEVNSYTDSVRGELIVNDNTLVDMVGDSNLTKLGVDATLTDATNKVGEIGISIGNTIADIKSGLNTKSNATNLINGDSVNSIRSINAETGTTHGDSSCAIGMGVSASGKYAHCTGAYSSASGYCSHAEGSNSTASGDTSHAEGKSSATGSYSHSEGAVTTARGNYSHAQGYQTSANGNYSHSEGMSTVASGNCTHVSGSYTTGETYAGFTIGHRNKINTGSATSYSSTHNAFVIGNGTSSSALSNAFRVTFNGNVYGLSAFNSTGADYGEYFEWYDGNINEEDRVGKFVTLEGERIRLATAKDNYIVGVVSANPSVVGDSHEDVWNDMYVKDVFGRQEYEWVDVAYKDTIDSNEIIKKEYHMKLNPDYDPSQSYIPRSNRKEWDIVGMLGKLVVYDDGTCVVNGYCGSNDDGIATSKENGYRVLKRISDNMIKILVK